MRARFVLLTSIFIAAMRVSAAPTLTTGTPADSYLATPSQATPSFGTAFSFDSLTPGSTFSASQYAAQGVTISSPDGLVVLPYSSQSAPNYLFDNSTNGTANIQITTGASNQIGIGISDSDSVNIQLQPLAIGGVAVGSAFNVTLPSTGVNPFNGYFVISDTTADIYGLRITQTAASASYSGLAIDDLQVSTVATPEPASLALLGAGALLFGITRLRKRA